MGRAVVSFEYDSTQYRKDGLIELRKGRNTHLIDKTGKFVS